MTDPLLVLLFAFGPPALVGLCWFANRALDVEHGRAQWPRLPFAWMRTWPRSLPGRGHGPRGFVSGLTIEALNSRTKPVDPDESLAAAFKYAQSPHPATQLAYEPRVASDIRKLGPPDESVKHCARPGCIGVAAFSRVLLLWTCRACGYQDSLISHHRRREMGL